jgi:hypothetical protein
MTNPTFVTEDTGKIAPDPSKHVNFTQGMVLGVDDFTQEFAYLDNRDQWLAREAIGYGSVSGLHVDSHLKDSLHEISVSPGVAISPRGQLIRVTTAQCAKIEAWLQLETTRTQLAERMIAADDDVNAYVVLCYRDCPVDELPVPGEPCRCDSETMAPSRIQDDFRLELTLQRPPQKEEDIVRDIVTWFRSIPVADFTPGNGQLDTFLNALRNEFQNLQSPPDSESYLTSDSPPNSLRIPRQHVCEWMRAALRVWVTELRPKWQEQWQARNVASCGCGCGEDSSCHGTGDPLPDQGRECVLLAAVKITRTIGTVQSVTLNEEHRPFVVHLRMLQELVLCGGGCGISGHTRSFGTAFTIDPHTIRLWLHYPETVSVHKAAVSVFLNGMEETNFTVSPVQANVYDLTLSASPLEPLSSSATIEIRLDAQLITDASSHDLADVLVTSLYRFSDYEEPILRIFGYAGTLLDFPVPNDTAIVAENVFGLTAKAPSPGLSPNFARADHTHGLPINPIPAHVANTTAHSNHLLVGDVGGTLGTNVIGKLQGKIVSAPSPLNNDVLQFVQTTADPLGKWIPKAISLSTVPTGNSSDTVVIAENSFPVTATPARAGTSLNFARADHTHGVPADPIPPHVANITTHANHQIAGDVTGIIGSTRITRLQGKDVIADDPNDGDILRYNLEKKTWFAVPNNASIDTEAVFHPTDRGPYFIVAAGVIVHDTDVVTPTYNELRIVQSEGNSFLLTFGPDSPTSPEDGYIRPKEEFTYIVKGHSLGKTPAYLHVDGFDDKGIRIRFMPTGNDNFIERAMIEISLFAGF